MAYFTFLSDYFMKNICIKLNFIMQGINLILHKS